MTKIVTVTEVADYLSISRMTAYNMVRNGKLPAFCIGSDWRIHIEAIDRWRLEQQRAAHQD